MINSIIKRTPLVCLLIPYFLGIIFDKSFSLSPIFWISVCGLFLFIGLINRVKTQSIFITIAIMLSLGGLNHRMKIRPDRAPVGDLIDGSEKSLIGIVESSESFGDNRLKIISRVLVNDGQEKQATWGKILLWINNSSRRYYYGDSLFFKFFFRHPSPKRNPGEFDYRKYLANHHIYALAYPDEKGIRVVSPNRFFVIRRFANHVKYKIQDLIHNSMKGEPAAILQALLVGVRGEISDQTEQAFIDSGVIHVLAVSGLHVGYVTLAIWVITGFLRLPLKPRVLITIIVLGFYVLVVDIKPSVFRAVIMASMVLIAKGWERQVNIYNSLAAAALIQTLIDPLQLFDMGFQLSFTAVFSIVYIYKRFEKLLPAGLKEALFSKNAVRYVVQMFLVSLAALVGTIPITIYYFNRIPIISMISNLLIIPLIGLIGALGFAQVIIGSVFAIVNIAYGEIEMLLIKLLRTIVQIFSSVPGAYIPVARISVIGVVVIYIFIFLLINCEKAKVRKVLVISGLILGNILVWRGIFIPPSLEITFLDVSQGDAAWIQLPNRQTILIDTGDRTFRRDYGKLVVEPFLKRKGVKHIDVLMLSHPHSDHIGGAPTILRNFEVGQIWESAIQAKSRNYYEIHHLADSLNIPVLTPFAGDMVFISDNLKLCFLHPSRKFLEKHHQNYNNGSLVCKLTYGENSFLFTGDAEEESEEFLVNWGDFLRSTVIKVPHHGSNTSSILPYVSLIEPEYALISVGKNNKFHHPAGSTVSRYQTIGAKIHRTDIDHAFQVKTNGKIVKVINWK